jgi:hypothetical protein
MILEIDNLLDDETANNIENFMLSKDFNWVYINSISGDCANEEAMSNDPKIKDTDGFMHMFVNDKQMVSPHVGIVNELLYALSQHTGKTTLNVQGLCCYIKIQRLENFIKVLIQTMILRIW